jgi:hypothetical protein
MYEFSRENGSVDEFSKSGDNRKFLIVYDIIGTNDGPTH